MTDLSESNEKDLWKPLLRWLLDCYPPANQNIADVAKQLSAELEILYPTVGSTEAQATEVLNTERVSEGDHSRPRQHDWSSGSSASDHLHQSPVLSPAAVEFRKWFPVAHSDFASAPNTVGKKDEEPEVLSDETYEPPDYTTPIIPRMETDPFGFPPAAGNHSETPEEPAQQCQLEAPHWVKYPDTR